jgi:hypothetical protein
LQPTKSFDQITVIKLYGGLFELADNWTPNTSNMEVRDFFKFLEQNIKYPNQQDAYMDEVVP